MSRHGAFGAAATLAVVTAIVLGFSNLGGRGRQRDIALDQRRSNDLVRISSEIDRWYNRDKKLPPDLNALLRFDPQLSLRDPITSGSYEYRVMGETQYQLCASFAADSTKNSEGQPGRPVFHFHPAGKHCFDVGAVRTSF